MLDSQCTGWGGAAGCCRDKHPLRRGFLSSSRCDPAELLWQQGNKWQKSDHEIQRLCLRFGGTFPCRAANTPSCAEPGPGKVIFFFKEGNKSRAVQQPLRAARGGTRARAPRADADQQALQQATISFVRFLEISSAENKLNKPQRSFNGFSKGLTARWPVSLTGVSAPTK